MILAGGKQHKLIVKVPCRLCMLHQTEQPDLDLTVTLQISSLTPSNLSQFAICVIISYYPVDISKSSYHNQRCISTHTVV